jgi:hypothetical protein
VLAIPIACIAWTVTHEEVFREPRDYCKRRSQDAGTIARRKFLLSIYLRVLFQPLGNVVLPDADALQTTVRRLARIPHCVLCTALYR